MLEQIPIPFLILLVLILVLCSAFFSASETGLMTLNRYRLRHTSKTDDTALRISRLLSRPDRLLGVLLIGNNFINICVSAIATIIGIRMLGDLGVLISTILTTFVILIFAEITPKTLAAIKPEAVSFWVARPVEVLLKLLNPLVVTSNWLANSLLRPIGINKVNNKKLDSLNTEELKTLLYEASEKISRQHQQMLLGILDLEQATVDDIMVPRSEVLGWDLALDSYEFEHQINNLHHTLIPIYDHNIDNIQGILHIRDLGTKLSTEGKITPETIKKIMQAPYFIPQGTSLYSQLLKFRNHKERLACIVNEYGEFIGIITVEDILEEIVGELSPELLPVYQEIIKQKDGSYLIDGSVSLRDLDRKLGWKFPVARVKTLSGLIIEYLENIPRPGTCILVNNYPIEVIKVLENRVKIVKIYPQLEN